MEFNFKKRLDNCFFITRFCCHCYSSVGPPHMQGLYIHVGRWSLEINWKSTSCRKAKRSVNPYTYEQWYYESMRISGGRGHNEDDILYG